jgi:hypothetical protein
MDSRPGMSPFVQEVEERSWAPKRRRVKRIVAAVKMYLQLDLEESILDLMAQSSNQSERLSMELNEHNAVWNQSSKASGRGRYISERRRAHGHVESDVDIAAHTLLKARYNQRTRATGLH